ncbi:MAG: hypothetical protein ACM3SX_07185 [Deltaproteobacteria bacterium]
MMTPRAVVRGALAVGVSAAAFLVIARASAVPISLHDAASARLRLSWSARPERIEVCRTLSAAELAQREEHMRQRVECDGRFATYALRVESDGRVLHESIVQGAGLRHDRPLFLIREIDVPPGAHRLTITFVRRETTDNDAAAFIGGTSPDADTGLFAGRAQREAAEHARRARAAIPPRLELDTALEFLPERVVVVSLDPERRTLRLLRETP